MEFRRNPDDNNAETLIRGGSFPPLFEEENWGTAQAYVRLTKGDLPKSSNETFFLTTYYPPDLRTFFLDSIGMSSNLIALNARDINALAETMKRLMEENKRLQRMASDLIDLVRGEHAEEKTIILREISRDEAKQEIKELFSTGEILYFSDIAEKLALPLEQVVEICQELQDEGEIEVADTV